MRKKLLEEYVEHVYSIKTEHQSQLDKGGMQHLQHGHTDTRHEQNIKHPSAAEARTMFNIYPCFSRGDLQGQPGRPLRHRGWRRGRRRQEREAQSGGCPGESQDSGREWE